jgi:hypothetical protein
MAKHIWTGVGIALAALLALLLWLLVREGAFEGEAALDERAAELDAGALDEPPFVDAGVLDAGADGGSPHVDDDDGPSIGLGGIARISVQHVSVTDKQNRKVLFVKRAHTALKLAAMQDGTFRVPSGRVEGAKVTLYRDKEGKISLASAMQSAPPSVRRSLSLPPLEKPESGNWAMEVGPIEVRDAILTIGFTNKPVRFRIDRGTVHVRQGPGDEKPSIYLDHIEGAMIEPSPLPKPVRIAYAKGIVRLGGSPMVELVARACLGLSEIRLRAVVPARKQRVQITADSFGIGGALGRMGLKIAGKKKSEKLEYHRGAVQLNAGLGCKDSPTQDPPEARHKKGKHKTHSQ